MKTPVPRRGLSGTGPWLQRSSCTAGRRGPRHRRLRRTASRAPSQHREKSGPSRCTTLRPRHPFALSCCASASKPAFKLFGSFTGIGFPLLSVSAFPLGSFAAGPPGPPPLGPHPKASAEMRNKPMLVMRFIDLLLTSSASPWPCRARSFPSTVQRGVRPWRVDFESDFASPFASDFTSSSGAGASALKKVPSRLTGSGLSVRPAATREGEPRNSSIKWYSAP